MLVARTKRTLPSTCGSFHALFKGSRQPVHAVCDAADAFSKAKLLCPKLKPPGMSELFRQASQQPKVQRFLGVSRARPDGCPVSKEGWPGLGQAPERIKAEDQRALSGL